MTVKRWVKFAVALVGWLTANEGRGGILVQFANVPEHAKTLQLLGYLARSDGPGPYQAPSWVNSIVNNFRMEDVWVDK